MGVGWILRDRNLRPLLQTQEDSFGTRRDDDDDEEELGGVVNFWLKGENNQL